MFRGRVIAAPGPDVPTCSATDPYRAIRPAPPRSLTTIASPRDRRPGPLAMVLLRATTTLTWLSV